MNNCVYVAEYFHTADKNIHTFELEIDGDSLAFDNYCQLKIWMNDNISSYSIVWPIVTINNDEQAMLFKLRWTR